jgi:two-component system response regulator NreC
MVSGLAIRRLAAVACAEREVPVAESKKTRLMIVEDHALLREGLKVLVEAEGDIEVIGEAEAGAQAVELALARRPHVVLMDIALVGLDGIEATRRINEAAPEVAVLILSGSPELYVARAALEAGAIGYMLKTARGSELRAGARAAASGTPYLSDDVLREVRERLQPTASRARRVRGEGPQHASAPTAVLTDREIEVLQLVAAGHSNKDIAKLLELSVKTVETHRMHVMEKLDIHEVSGLTRYALRKGLING